MTTTLEGATDSAAQISPGELVSAKTICLVLKMGSFGNTKQASLAPVSVDADKSLLRLSKTLIDSPELQAIQKFDRETAAKIRQMAFNSMFKGGVYLLPIAMVTTADEILKTAAEERKKLIDAACEKYLERVQETSQRLGVQANPNDYPPVERFRAAFYFEYSYVTFETPSRLKAISPELFKAEAEKARAKLESVAEECQQAMRAGLLSLVDHLAERLTPEVDPETGQTKTKRLHQSTITHLNDFLATFDLRNVTDDAQLGEIVQRARDVMDGVDHASLKNSEDVRKHLVDELTKVKNALDPLVVDKGNRSITFEDE